MVIRRSASTDVRQLVADLGATGPHADTRRETAIARLAVIGPRATSHLVDAFRAATASPERVAILRALETAGDSRAVEVVREGLEDSDSDCRCAAAALAGALLDGPRGTDALDRLTATALDPDQPSSVRHAAIKALAHLPPRTLAPLRERLESDPDPLLHTVLTASVEAAASGVPLTLAALASGDLPADPQRVLLLLHEEAARAPLATLHKLVGAVRAREQTEQKPARRAEWRAVRGAVHLALARRGSRVAAYDLRETVEAADEILPEAFTEAISLVGDSACLEALAAAWMRTPTPAGAWRESLASAAATLAAREGLTRRHAVVKRIHARWGADAATLLDVISTPSRSARGSRPAART